MAIKVTGLRETTRALREVDRGLLKLVTDDLKKAAEPVAVASREKIGHYRGARTGRIRPVVTGRAVYVRQSEPKRTGLRGDFGALQWRKLAQSLEEKEGEVVEGVREAFDRLQHNAGL